MFLAPVLYVVYAFTLRYFHSNYSSYLDSEQVSPSQQVLQTWYSHASLPAAAKTWMIIPLGIAAFIVFYVVFRFAITKFDLKTPGT